MILGDYAPDTTKRQLNLLSESLKSIPIKIETILRLHPLCPKMNEFSSFQITDEKLDKLFEEFNIIYTSNSTSAAIDAYCAGKQVISYFDADELNLSSLRGLPNTKTVNNSQELAKALLLALEINNSHIVDISKVFEISSTLNLWKKFLI